MIMKLADKVTSKATKNTVCQEITGFIDCNYQISEVQKEQFTTITHYMSHIEFQVVSHLRHNVD